MLLCSGAVNSSWGALILGKDMLVTWVGFNYLMLCWQPDVLQHSLEMRWDTVLELEVCLGPGKWIRLQCCLKAAPTCKSLYYLHNFVFLFYICILNIRYEAVLLLVVSQLFLLKHMFPKALVLYFLCSDLLLLPYHMC